VYRLASETIYKNARDPYSVYAGKGFLKHRKLLLMFFSYSFFRRNYNYNKLGYKKLYASFTLAVNAKWVYRKGSARNFRGIRHGLGVRHETLNTLTPLTFAEYAAIITYID